jgi:hypothetical protein
MVSPFFDNDLTVIPSPQLASSIKRGQSGSVRVLHAAR